MKTWTSIVVIFALGLGACTAKKRDEALPYGADKDLLTISDYAGKEFTVQTQGVLTTSQDKKSLKLNSNKNAKAKLRAFDFVKYDASNDKLNLLDKSLMLGKTNHQYRMRYEFEGTLLKVYKLGTAEELSAQEVATAQDAKSSAKLDKKIPVVAYRVSFFTVENQRNEKDETTRTLKLTDQNSAAISTHFKIDYNSKSSAKFLPKELVFDSSILDGEWYFATTISSQNYQRKGMNGYMMTWDEEGNTSTKVVSQKRENAIDLINTNIDERLKQNLSAKKENQSVALSIKADFIDYRMALEGRSTGINEEAFTEGAWDQRKYVKLKLDGDNTELLDVQFDDGYFSFLTFDRVTKEKYRTALYNVKEYRKNNPAYTPKVYLKEDRRVFGFFSETKNSLKTGEKFRREDFEQDTLVDRYNPMREKIVFSLNHEAPEWSVELAQKSVDAWDQAFRQAGISTKLELSKERAEIGDIRANVLNMIGDVDGGEPYWGVAPKVVDPDTGETISSTANINLMSIIYRGDTMVEQYLRAKSGVLKKNYLMGFPIPSLQIFEAKQQGDAQSNKVETQNVRLDKVQFTVADSNTGKINKNAYSFDASKIKEKVRKSGSMSAFHSEATFEDLNNNIIPELETLCPAVKAMGDSLTKGETVDRTTNEFKKIRRDCSLEISKVRIISTLIHEMGHNFGLRHNFRGSTDWRNFFPGVQDWKSILDPKTGKLNLPPGVALGAPVKTTNQQGQELTYYIRSSSVMDYTTYNHDTMIIPGPYDVAALRWAYTGTVLDASDKIVKVNDKEPLEKQVGKTMRAFAYCTDEDIDGYGRDALCNREDEGLTPSQIVKTAINRFDAYVASNYQKLDRNELELAPVEQKVTFFKVIAPMLKIYQNWRTMVAKEVGFSDAYLEKISSDDYQKIVDTITNVTDKMSPEERAYRSNLADYRKAADQTFAFLTNLVFHPDYTCIVNRSQTQEPDITMISFSTLQRDVFSSFGVSADNCKNEVVDRYLKATMGPAAKVVGAGGLSTIDLRHNLADSALENGPDRLGIVNNKVFAIDALTDREAYFMGTYTNDFYPNFMDEPHYRDLFTSMVTERMQLGQNLANFGVQTKEPVVSPAFEVEKYFLGYMYSKFKQGLRVPGKLEATNKRLELFTVLPSYYRSFSDMSQVSCARLQGIDYCAGPENMIARSLLNSLSKIQTMREAKLPSQEALDLFISIVKPVVPEKVTEKTAYSGKDFTKLLESLNSQAAKLSKEKSDDKDAAKNEALAADLRTLTQALLGPEIKVINAAIYRRLVKANSEALTDVEFEQKKEEILSLDIIKAASQSIGDDGKNLKFELSIEVLKQRFTKIAGSVQELNLAYQKDKTELDAQADVLMDAVFLR